MMFKRFQNRDYATKEGYQARLTGAPIEKTHTLKIQRIGRIGKQHGTVRIT